MPNPLRLFFVLLLGLVFSLGSVLRAQVKASLVADSVGVRPGESVTVALKLDHEHHWHTYWINAGTGYATSLSWTLPEGWTAGDIQWPVPRLLKDSTGAVIGQGYEDVLYLPVQITAPATAKPGAQVTLRGKAGWLMCKETCVPGEAELSFTLNVVAETPAASPERAAIRSLSMPRKPAPGQVSMKRVGAWMEIRVAGGASLKDPHFFPESELVVYDQSQEIKYEGASLLLRAPLAPAAATDPGRINGVLAYAGEKGGREGLALVEAEAAAPVEPQAKAPGSSATLLGTLGLAFLGGLILNLMPCVFPVLGIKILGFVNQAGSKRSVVALHGVVFFVGVLLSFWALVAVLFLLRAGGAQMGWGFQLQSAPFVFALALIMLVFALSLSGVFEFGLGATGIGAGLQMKEGYVGTFFTGILATVVATPCSAPFLAPALGTALALPPLESFAVFTAIAVGLGTPYLLLSLFPSAVKVLPRPGAWMETFRQFMAFPLYGTVAYLLWVLAGQTSEYGLFYAMLGLVLMALAAWAYGRFQAPGKRGPMRKVSLVLALVSGALGLWIGLPEKAQDKTEAHSIVWEPWSPEAITKATAEGKTVYVDFTARWCFTCQTNKKVVFGSERVLSFLKQNKVLLLRGDWTNSDPKITAELARWGRSAVPFNLVYKPGATEPKVLPEILTPDIVLEALK